MRGEAGFPNEHQSNYMYNQCAFFFFDFFFLSSGILRQVVLNALYHENNKTVLSFRRKRKEQHRENFTAKNNNYSLLFRITSNSELPIFRPKDWYRAVLYICGWSTYCFYNYSYPSNVTFYLESTGVQFGIGDGVRILTCKLAL